MRRVPVAGVILLKCSMAAAAPLLWGPNETDALRVQGAGSTQYLGRALAAGDLNGDGRDDLAMQALGHVLVEFGASGPRRFVALRTTPAALTIVPRHASDNPTFLGIADVDGDGGDDLLAAFSRTTASPFKGEVWIFHHRATWPAQLGAADADVLISSVKGMGVQTVGDLTGDGIADLILSQRQLDGRLAFSVFGGGPGWPASIDFDAGGADLVIVSPDNPGVPEPLELGDVTGDGRTDLVFMRVGLGRPQLVVAGRDVWPAVIDLAVTPPDAVIAHGGSTRGLVGDVTGDGVADILLPGYSGNYVVRVVAGGPTLGAPLHATLVIGPSSPVHRDPRALAVRDLDGDGVDDLVMSWLGDGPRKRQVGGGTVAALRGPLPAGTSDVAALPTLWRAHGHRIDAGLTRAVVLDYDGDGKLDIATGAHGVHDVSLMSQESGEVTVWTAASFVEPAAAVDLRVDPVAGSDVADGLGWSTALRTLQGALLRVDGRTGPCRVLVARGTLPGPVVIGPGVAVEGGYDVAGGPRQLAPSGTVLTGAPIKTIVTVRPGEGADRVRLEGLALTDGWNGGVTPGLLQEGGDLELAHVVFERLTLLTTGETCTVDPWSCASTGPVDGGVAMDLRGASATLDNVLVQDCKFVPSGCACFGQMWNAPLAWSSTDQFVARHLTLVGTSPGLMVTGDATIENSILRGLEDWGQTSVVSSLVGDQLVTPAGSTTIGEPIFIGPGVPRLAQVATGQAADSPGVDAGIVDAADDCMTTGCMSSWSTRIDGAPDSGPVDLGFHWGDGPNAQPIFAGATGAAPAGDCRLRVTWDPAVDPDGDALMFLVFASDSSGAQDLSDPIATLAAPATSWEESVAYGHERFYLVRARDDVGWLEQNLVEVSAVANDTTPPDASLTLTALGGCSVKASFVVNQTWCAAMGAVQLHRSGVAGFVPSPVTLISTSSGPVTDTVPANGIWYYRRNVQDVAGNEGVSAQEEIRVDTCSGPVPAPLPPVLQALQFQAGSVIAPFQAGAGTTFVRLYRGTLAALLAGAPNHVASAGADGVIGTLDDVGCCRADTSPAVDSGDTLGEASYWVATAVGPGGESLAGLASTGSPHPPGVADCP